MTPEGQFPLTACNKDMYCILEKHKGKKTNNN